MLRVRLIRTWETSRARLTAGLVRFGGQFRLRGSVPIWMRPARTWLAPATVALCATLYVACSTVDRSRPDAAPTHNSAGPPHRLERTGEAWTLVAPDGRPYFARAVSVVDGGVSPDDYDPENPAYASFRHYPDRRAWAGATLERLRRWGFNAIGAWGDFETIRAAAPERDPPYFTPVLHIGSTVGFPWLDMWDAKLLARMDREAAEKIRPLRDDGRVVGYYSDNELGWWNVTLFKMTVEHPPSSGQRRRLVAMLKDHYRGDWGALGNAFFAEGVDGWRGLERGGRIHPRPGRGAVPVLRRFLGMMASRYYQLMHDTIRRHDGRALVLGDRYQSFYYPEVASAAAPYVDAISTNVNAAWNDGTFPRFYLDTLHRLSGKPVLVSEFYAAANENRTGNRNSRGVYPVVQTQAERAAAARTTLEAVARLPYVVGAEWFQLYDEARHGRPDGENFNFGLVDIHDRPYEELTGALASFDPAAARASAPARRSDATGGVPPAPADPFADFEITRALKHWDRERGFVLPSSPLPMADLYVCWTPRAVYLGVYCLDIVEAAFYRDGRIPKEDRMLWTIRLPGRPEPIRARLGASREPIVNDATLRLQALSGLDLNVRNVAAIELPAALFGKTELRADDVIEFSTTLTTHGQAYTTDWAGRLTLAP